VDPVIHRGSNYAAKIAELNSLGIYTIARVVVFKDPILPDHMKEWAIKRNDGSIWLDRKRIAWVDPSNENVWDYNIEMAKEAAKLGFREIQFDYVRFPTDGNTSEIHYDFSEHTTKKDIINSFLLKAKQELEPYNVYLAADVFGLTTSTRDDMRIGQQFEEIAAIVDYICPMMYPSHYAKGSYGLADPDRSPYETVYKGLLDAQKKIADLENPAIIRPWLQDFSLQSRYTEKEVLLQRKAVYDSDLIEWIFWNAGNRYKKDAYF